jgi:hypothetical protein
MRLPQVVGEIVAALDGHADGIGVFAFEPDTLSPPAAFLGLPRQAFIDTRYGFAGKWLRELPLTLVVTRESERDIWARLQSLEAWAIGRLERNPGLKAGCQLHVLSLEQARPVQLGGAAFVAEDLVLQVIVEV